MNFNFLCIGGGIVNLNELIMLEKNRKYRNWIEEARDRGYSWEEISYCLKNNDAGLKEFLERKKEDFWDIDSVSWKELVNFMKVNTLTIPGFIGNPKKEILSLPTSPGSCWIKYIKKLESKGFTFESLNNIEKSASRIVSQLSQTTDQDDPIRGMVVGNVQSGKTANMAGVISLAADMGYNLFIVLSGTIENLRVQTRNRLMEDLNFSNSNLVFHKLENLSLSTSAPDRLQDLQLEENSRHRYLNVCLKNPTRLKDLLNWINKSDAQKEQLKILVLDDEADQAGVNTANMSKDMITTINRYIKDLVFAKTAKDQIGLPYGSMNYIGYTATPYANLLNEATETSLYPKNFIMALNSSAEYIGPQEIFGMDGINLGLPILNVIKEDEIEYISSPFFENGIPNELKKSLLWYICTIAIYRFWGIKKPVSMLIHTSQRVEKHKQLAEEISKYCNDQFNTEQIRKEIKDVYITQTRKLSIDDFIEEMPRYHFIDEIKEYPDFKEIEDYIEYILLNGINYIMMDDDKEIKYGKGIHLCVDNCKYNKDNGDTIMRLVYPDKDDIDTLCTAPAFIVIGGATLSRGLTIEGLTCSFFLRTTRTADSLMQMGRWFGYRKGYELLPRIWLSSRSIGQFRRLTKLDCDLRNEIHNMEKLNFSPSEYGPRIDTFPDYRFLKITSKNKMQKAINCVCDYSNKNSQTIRFYDDKKILESNLMVTKEFINELGEVDKNKIIQLNNKYANENSLIWFDQDYRKVLDYLSKLKFPQQTACFNDIEGLKKWFEKEYEEGYISNFNVVIPSLLRMNGTKQLFINKYVKINLPSRSNIVKNHDDGFSLKALAAPNDLIMDINTTTFNKKRAENIYLSDDKSLSRMAEKRIEAGLIDVPLLVIYIIDNDLKCRKLDDYLVGYYIYIPYGSRSENTRSTNKVTVKLEFDVGGDIYEDEM